MKINLLNTSDTIGGAAIACRRLNKALSGSGIDSTMLVQEKLSGQNNIINLSNSWYSKKSASARFILEKSFFLFYEKSKNIRFSFSLANTGMNIGRRYDFSDTDIIHLHWINQGFLSLKRINELFSMKKPVVWTLHDMWPFTGGCHHSRGCEKYIVECNECPYLARPGKHDLSNKIWEKKKEIYKNSDLTIVTPSRWLAGCAKKSALFNDTNVFTVPNPIDTNLYKPGDRQSARKHFNLPPDKIIIGFAALNTSNYFKGGEYLLNSLKFLSENYPSLNNKIILLILGKNIDNLKYDLPYEIIFKGYLKNEADIINFYRALDLYVLPSLEENLPNTIMEALSCGIPAAGFNVGGMPEMIDNKANGYLAEYKSSEDLARGILWITENAGRYNQLCKSARDKALENYDENTIASQYGVIYEKLLDAVL